MLASTFISGGMNALQNPHRLAPRAQPLAERIAPVVERTGSLPSSLDSMQLVRVNGAVQVVGGALLASGKMPRLAALMLAGSLVPTTLAGHRFWAESDPQQRRTERVQFIKNVSMGGGLLLAGVDTDGKPSLAWRLSHRAAKLTGRRPTRRASKQAAKRARKQAAKRARKQLAKRARKQAAERASKQSTTRTRRPSKTQIRRIKVTAG
jgi:putative oxidoreductase